MAKVSGKDGKIILSGSQNMEGATGTTSIAIPVDEHGLLVGDRVLIEEVVGMTDLNGEWTVATVPDADNFTVVIPLTAQTYVSGGKTQLCISITGWTLDLTAEVIPTTDSSNTIWDAFIPTDFSGGTGTFEGFYESGTNDLTGSYPIILRQSGAIYYTGTALITGNSSVVDVPGTEAVKKTYTFTCTASVALTTA